MRSTVLSPSILTLPFIPPSIYTTTITHPSFRYLTYRQPLPPPSVHQASPLTDHDASFRRKQTAMITVHMPHSYLYVFFSLRFLPISLQSVAVAINLDFSSICRHNHHTLPNVQIFRFDFNPDSLQSNHHGAHPPRLSDFIYSVSNPRLQNRIKKEDGDGAIFAVNGFLIRDVLNHAYGGVLSAGAVRERIIRAFLVEEQKIVKKVLKIQKSKKILPPRPRFPTFLQFCICDQVSELFYVPVVLLCHQQTWLTVLGFLFGV
ncbi:hypothetical protein L1987_53460 [Smallanthus sonchifolius]|uniref:Uncharacterized protein n=1 Tax=Smallanthus sonchifolius TaxID=185202 RepID=A0ACB9EVG1_9ASTR|nr:hypothetical protein L1987_53460 [Smallanthus sonchifolius]